MTPSTVNGGLSMRLISRVCFSLVKPASGWAKVELVGVAASPEFLESRRPSPARPLEPVVGSKKESADEAGGDALRAPASRSGEWWSRNVWSTTMR